MIQIKYDDIIYNLPAYITETDDVLRHISSLLNISHKEFILLFNKIFLSRYFNYNLLEIGFSPNEYLEIVKLNTKTAVFNITKFDYNLYFEIDQYCNVFTTKQKVANLFFTVPQNIIIKYKEQILSDSDNLLSFKSNNSTPFQISVEDRYDLFRIYFHQIHFICMSKKSTVKQLKETISIYSQENKRVNTECTYCDNLIDLLKENNNDIDSISLNLLSTTIPLFEFTDLKPKNTEVYTITAIIDDDKYDIHFTRYYQASCQISLYQLTVLIERDLGIDRSLFLFDKSNFILDDIVSFENNKFSFKLSEYLSVKINDKNESMSLLTTMKDIQNLYNFDDHNFGIIVNNHFIYNDPIGKFLLINFMCTGFGKNETEILFKKSIDPSQQFTYTKEENQKRTKKKFILTKKMKFKQVANIYLLQNFNSIKILKKDKNEILYTNSKKQTIYCTLFKENNMSRNISLNICGDNLRVIDLLYNVNSYRDSFFIFSYYFQFCDRYDNVIPFFNDKKLNYWDLLSDIFFDENNTIKIYGNIDKTQILILNLLDNNSYIISYRNNFKAKDIINKYCKLKNPSSKCIKLYADFNELKPNDIPTYCKLNNNLLTINEEIEQKKFIINNLNNIAIELKIRKKDFSNLKSKITEIFHIPDNKLKITAKINEIGYILSSSFNAGSFLNNCEIFVQYEYIKNNKMTFKYEGKSKMIELDVDDLIENTKKKVQQEFNIWHISKSLIYFTFYNFEFLSTKSFSFYQVPENAIINICIKKDILPIKISILENDYFEGYFFKNYDVIDDVINHFESKYDSKIIIYEDREKKNQINVNTILNREMNLYLSSEKIKIKCEGSLGDDEIEVSEILKVKDAVNILMNTLKSDVYIFTKNDNNNNYEPVEEEQLLKKIERKIFVHISYSNIEFNYKIFDGKKHISELNTIYWLKKAYICKSLFMNTNDFKILNNKNKALNDTDLIKDVLNANKKQLFIKIKDKNSHKRYIVTSENNKKISSTIISYDVIINDDPMITMSLKKNAYVKNLITKIVRMKGNISKELVSVFYHEKKLADFTLLKNLTFHENDFIKVIICRPEDIFNRATRNIKSEWSDEDDDEESMNQYSDTKEDVKNENEKEKEKSEEDDDDDDKEEDGDEEEEKEEDLFTSKKKNIFRFLSVSFLDKFNKIKIGRGVTSDVFKVSYDKYPTKFFALKVIDSEIIRLDEDNKNDDDDDDDTIKVDINKMRKFFNEYEVLNHFDHPNIIKTYGLCLGDKTHPPAILLEFCQTNLKKVVKTLTNENKIEIIYELSEAMKKIHESGIIHRDLKPENILIDESNHVKVCDFGISTFIKLDSETNSRTQFAGTMKFMAPELLNEKKNYDEKVDVYSFGVIVYWILDKGNYPPITFVEVANGKQAIIPESFSVLSSELIQQCWSIDPKKRPSFEEISNVLKNRKNELI